MKNILSDFLVLSIIIGILLGISIKPNSIQTISDNTLFSGDENTTIAFENSR